VREHARITGEGIAVARNSGDLDHVTFAVSSWTSYMLQVCVPEPNRLVHVSTLSMPTDGCSSSAPGGTLKSCITMTYLTTEAWTVKSPSAYEKGTGFA
jgi:hypothetical protein